MSGTKRLVLLVLVCLLIGFSAALANNDGPSVTIDKVSCAPQVRELAALFIDPDSSVDPSPRPRPVDPQPVLGRPGPAASSGVNAFSTGMGGALMAPRGGGIATRKQQADRTIRKLIRSLD